MKNPGGRPPHQFLVFALSLLFLAAHSENAGAGAFRMLYAFYGGSDGAVPNGELRADKSGDLWGVTDSGGNGNCHSRGCGTVFRLTPDGVESVVYAFLGRAAAGEGETPQGPLFIDKAGDVFGATQYGGSGTCYVSASDQAGCGTVFKLTPAGTETVLYNFLGGSDGYGPVGGLLLRHHLFYGATFAGGHNNTTRCPPFGRGCGTVFALDLQGNNTSKYVFQAGTDGSVPEAGLVMDGAGNLFGTATEAGTGDCGGRGCGTVFELSLSGAIPLFQVLHSFTGGADGSIPLSLIIDAEGNLSGVAGAGGMTPPQCGSGCGTIFRIDSGGNFSVLHTFEGGLDGYNPRGSLIEDADGNLYGVTGSGGKATCDCGTVYKLAPDGTKTLLHAFHGADGKNPGYGMIIRHRHLYGTTQFGGNSCGVFDGCGTVFSIKLR